MDRPESTGRNLSHRILDQRGENPSNPIGVLDPGAARSTKSRWFHTVFDDLLAERKLRPLRYANIASGQKKRGRALARPRFCHEFDTEEEIPIPPTAGRCHRTWKFVMSLNNGTRLEGFWKLHELFQDRSRKPRRIASLTAAGRLRTWSLSKLRLMYSVAECWLILSSSAISWRFKPLAES